MAKIQVSETHYAAGLNMRRSSSLRFLGPLGFLCSWYFLSFFGMFRLGFLVFLGLRVEGRGFEIWWPFGRSASVQDLLPRYR